MDSSAVESGVQFLIDALESAGASDVLWIPDSSARGAGESQGLFFTLPNGVRVAIEPTDEYATDPSLEVSEQTRTDDCTEESAGPVFDTPFTTKGGVGKTTVTNGRT